MMQIHTLTTFAAIYINLVFAVGRNTEAEMITAILHDVVEDSDWTFEGLREAGFSAEALEAVNGVTSRSDESYEQFIERAARNPIARQVKIADLEDNMNILRIGEIKPKDLERLEKYHKSWRSLTSAESEK